jgi:hypothetical protein
VVLEYPHGAVLNHLHAIEVLLNDATGKQYPWPQPPAARFGSMSADVLNRAPALVFFLPPSGTSSGSRASASTRGAAPLTLTPQDARAVAEFEMFALARTDLAYRASATRSDGGGGGGSSSAGGSEEGGAGRAGGGGSGSAGRGSSMALQCGRDSRTGGAPPPAFLYGPPDAITTQVLAWAKIAEQPPLIAYIDFPAKVKYVWRLTSTDDVTVASLADFVGRYEDGRLRPELLR